MFSLLPICSLSVLHGYVAFSRPMIFNQRVFIVRHQTHEKYNFYKIRISNRFSFLSEQESDFIQLLPFSGGLSNNFCTEPIFQRHMITKRVTKLDSWEIVLKKCADEYHYNWTFVKTWIPVKTLFRAISPLKLVLPWERLLYKNVKRQMWEIQLQEDGAWLRSRQWW